jgi:uncharacterized membrane-anchored protein
MATLIRVALAGFFLACFQPAEAGQKVYPKTEEALEQAFQNLNWEHESKKYSLAVSHGEYQLPEGLFILRDDEARQFMFLNNGVESPDTEAVVYDPDRNHQLIFEYFQEGYVSDDDWADLDADLLLEGVTESTEEGNAQRIENRLGAISIIGWSQEPYYDESSRTAYWAIKAKDQTGIIVNAIALKLGRKGFSKIIWVGEAAQFSSSENLLREALDNHRFEKGFRYADYSSGDKIAAFGLASLVAVSAGSKSGKGVVAGVFAMLLIFAKKLWFLIFLPFVFVWKWIKSLFTGRQES